MKYQQTRPTHLPIYIKAQAVGLTVCLEALVGQSWVSPGVISRPKKKKLTVASNKRHPITGAER